MIPTPRPTALPTIAASRASFANTRSIEGACHSDGWIACSQSNDAITIECKNPMM